MPNTPDRGKQQPGSPEERRRLQLNDRPLEETDEGRIEAPGIEEEDLPGDATTQVNSNPENRRSDREQASEAGRKANDASD